MQLLRPGTLIIKKLADQPQNDSTTFPYQGQEGERSFAKHPTLRMESHTFIPVGTGISANSASKQGLGFTQMTDRSVSRNHEELRTKSTNKAQKSSPTSVKLDMIWNESVPAEEIIEKLKLE